MPTRSDPLGDEPAGVGNPARDLDLTGDDDADVPVFLVERPEPRRVGLLLRLLLEQHRGLLKLVDAESIRLAQGDGKPLALVVTRDSEERGE